MLYKWFTNGPHRSPEKQFQSLIKHICAKFWLYHNTNKEKEIISFLRIKWSFIYVKSPSLKNALCQVLV